MAPKMTTGTGPSPRVKAAFKAMKNLGIAKEKTKPVLKKLLELYNKNWELIEAENYRVLADTIFEFDEVAEKEKEHSQLGESSREAGHMQDEPMQGHPEPLINMSFMMHQGDGEPSARSIASALKTLQPELKEPDSSPSQCIQSLTESPQCTHKRVESHPVSPHQPDTTQDTGLGVEGSEPSANLSARGPKVVIEQTSQNSQLHGRTVEPDIVLSGKQKCPQINGLTNDELFTDEILTLEPLAVVHPGSRSDLF